MGLFARDKPLTEYQIRFRDLYRESNNVAKCAEMLGRTREWGRKELLKPYMQDLIQEKEERIRTRADKAKEDITARIEWLRRVRDGEESFERTIVTKDGDVLEISDKPTWPDRLKAADMLHKMYGDYSPIKHHVEGGGITFVQVLNSRGPLPPGAEVKTLENGAGILSLPNTTEPVSVSGVNDKGVDYEQCPKCQEAIESSFFQKHVDGCPGV